MLNKEKDLAQLQSLKMQVQELNQKIKNLKNWVQYNRPSETKFDFNPNIAQNFGRLMGRMLLRQEPGKGKRELQHIASNYLNDHFENHNDERDLFNQLAANFSKILPTKKFSPPTSSFTKTNTQMFRHQANLLQNIAHKL